MTLRVAIVDDEPLARERLRRLLNALGGVVLVAECTNGAEAVQAVRRHQPDLLFLDVQMPGMDGFAVVQTLADIGTPVPRIVFVTGFDQYAVRAFEARALDYLLKPTNKTRLAEAVRRAREQCATTPEQTGLSQALRSLLAQQKSPQRLSRIAVRGPDGTAFVPLGEIDWIEAAGNYAILHVGKTTHILRETMSALETQIGDDTFMRVSRSAIVNLHRVREIQTLAPGEHRLLLAGGHLLPITRNLREVEERLRFT